MSGQRKWWLIVALAAMLCGCASQGPSTSEPSDTESTSEVVPANELVGRGMVLQKQGGAPMLCLGPVAASLPPQCGGPVIRNWDWSEAGHFASAGGVMWGAYGVTGMLADGEFTQTRRPVPSTDASPPEARPTPEPPGNGKEMQLLLLQRELTSLRGQPILMSGAENGYLVIDVVYDDGSLQRELDSKYGPRIILIRSALKPLGGSPAS
jgi:hypothetical protein